MAFLGIVGAAVGIASGAISKSKAAVQAQTEKAARYYQLAITPGDTTHLPALLEGSKVWTTSEGRAAAKAAYNKAVAYLDAQARTTPPPAPGSIGAVTDSVGATLTGPGLLGLPLWLTIGLVGGLGYLAFKRR